MKLRHRMSLFSTAQLVVFGVLFAIALGGFERKVLPLFRTLLSGKSERVVRILGAELDVGLAADDVEWIAKTFERIDDDADFSYAAVRDTHGKVVFTRGTAPRDDAFAGAPNAARDEGDTIRAWAPVSLEGMKLGSVAVVLTTARLDTLDTWAKRLAVVTAILWLLCLGYSIRFARSLVTPIRTMMDFTRDVAGGSLSQRLAITPPGELRDLRDYLNQMTADLEGREQERKLAASRAEALQEELRGLSRVAGMAEIEEGSATSPLRARPWTWRAHRAWPRCSQPRPRTS